ncbi:MAG: hypothetical protein WB990_05605 [Candidatus Acidiferrales bacterium]
MLTSGGKLARGTRILAVGALFGAGFIAFPNVLHAQAAPGPMRPPDESSTTDSAQSASGSATRPEEPLMPERKQLFGYWRLNVDESDDAHEKLKEASNDGSVASPRGGGGGNGGGGGGQPGGIHIGGMGSPFPGGGGGGGGSSRRSGNSGPDSELDRAQMQELLNPAGSLTVALKDPAKAEDTKGSADSKTTADTKGTTSAATPAAPPKDPNNEEIDVTDDLGRTRVYYTDGRKVPKPKEEKYQEFDAYWVESYRLVAEYDGSHGARVTRTYEPAPGGKQLYETVRLDRTRSYGPVEIRYVYDLAPEHRAIGTK